MFRLFKLISIHGLKQFNYPVITALIPDALNRVHSPQLQEFHEIL